MNGPRPSFSFGRRWNMFLNVALSIAAVVTLAAMANYLAVRHFKRMHWAAHMPLKLSPRTLQVLDLLTNTVHVTVYFDSEDELYGRVVGLLKEYQFASPKIEVERVDYLRDPAAAKVVKARYKLTQLTEKNLVIFECEGRPRIVRATELSDYDIQSLIEQRTNEVRRTHFRGELAFTSAILSVAVPRPIKACFLTGHGEHDPASTDQSIGYSKFAAVLSDECNIPFIKLSLSGNAEVPADCSLIIIPGPTDALAKEEIDKLQRYLDQGGRMLVLFNFWSLGRPTGLEKLLAQYEVAVGDNIVVDRENSLGRDGNDVIVSDMGSHAVVSSLRNSRIDLTRPRTVRQARSTPPRSSSTKVEELFITGPQSVVLTGFRRGLQQVEPTIEHRGAVPLMAVVERGAVPGVTAERGATRLAVIGDSLFLQNDAIESSAHRDFAANVVNWLVDQGVLLAGVAPRPVTTYRITMTQSQLAAARWVLLAGLPGAVLLVGALVWWRRRS